MSDIIKNTAKITYNNGANSVETCEVTTSIDKTLETHKRAYTTDDIVIEESGTTPDGIVGEDRKITNEIELLNYSSTDFTNVVISDHIYVTDSNGNVVNIGTAEEVENYISSHNNLGANDTVEVTEVVDSVTGDFKGYEVIITLNDSLQQETEKKVRYEIQLPDTVQVGSMVTGSASVDYNENPKRDQNNTHIPEQTENLAIKLSYTSIESKKEVQDLEGHSINSVLCGQEFNYVLSFENTGDIPAVVDNIIDSLPIDFVIKEETAGEKTIHPGVIVKIEGAAKAMSENTDYEITRGVASGDKRDLIIAKAVGQSTNISIPAVSKLIVSITGYVECLV